jgi:hypothetical protein
MPQAPSKATIGTLDPYIQSLPSAVQFSKSLEAKFVTLPKPGKDPKFPQNLRPIRLLSTTSKVFEKLILKIFQNYIKEGGLLNTSEFGFHVRVSTTFNVCD